MTKPAFEDVLLLNGAASLGKAAVLCSMIDNEHDDEIVVFLAKYGIKSVITRAGGNGENLKNKILRNTFGAAENSGIMAVTQKSTRCCDFSRRNFTFLRGAFNKCFRWWP